MPSFTRGALAAAALAVAAPAAHAVSLPGYSGLYVFGDSLVDAGVAEALRPGVASDRLGYFGGRFSNGYTFADDLGYAINGRVTTAFNVGGTNFAVGGAQAYGPADASPDFATQLGYFAATRQRIASDALVLVTFGGNDVRSILRNTTATPTFADARTALENGLKTLIASGARNIVVTGLPDIGDLPDTFIQTADAISKDPANAAALSRIPAIANERSVLLNGIFRTVVDDLYDDPLTAPVAAANVSFFDLLDYEGRLIADPGAFGLQTPFDSDRPCITGAPVSATPVCAGKLYFDTIHPTRQVHQAIANAIVTSLGGTVPEPATWATMVAGFGLIGGTLRRRRVAVAA